MQSQNEGVARGAQDVADTPASRAKESSRLRTVWRWFWSPSAKYSLGSLVIVAFVAGILFWGGFNTAMEVTNTESFCITCHEMQSNVYREYQMTAHYTNRSGVRAVCSDCHVPKDWFHKTVRKVQASNELLYHFLGSIDTREKFDAKRLTLAQSVWRTMKSTDSRECRNCHNLLHMDFAGQEKRSAEQHQTSLQDGKTCIDCHRGLSHRLPAGAEEAYQAVERDFPTVAVK